MAEFVGSGDTVLSWWLASERQHRDPDKVFALSELDIILSKYPHLRGKKQEFLDTLKVKHGITFDSRRHDVMIESWKDVDAVARTLA